MLLSRALLLATLCLGAVLPLTLQASDLPTLDSVQSQIDTLPDRKLPEPDQARLQQTLEETRGFLQRQADNEKSLAALKEQLAAAPTQTDDARDQLRQLKDSPPADIERTYGNARVPQLEQLLAERNQQLNEWQKALGEANSLIISTQTRPEKTQADIGTNQDTIQALNAQLKSGKSDGRTLTEEELARLRAQAAALTSTNQLLRQQLNANSQLQELGDARRELLAERIARQEKEALALQALINGKRRALSAETFAELSKDAKQAGTAGNLQSSQSNLNLQYSDYLLRATDRLNELTRENLETQQKLDNLNQVDQALDEQIAALDGSQLLARILYQQKQALPSLQVDQKLADQIGDIRLYQFELNQQRNQLDDPVQYVEQLMQQHPEEQASPELRSALLGLVNTRVDLLDRLSRELNALLNESINLQLNQQQLLDTARQLGNTLDEQMFWIPSNAPLDWDWFAAAPQRLKQQLTNLPVQSVASELVAGLFDKPQVFLPLLLLIGVLLWRRQRISQKLGELHQHIGHFKRDSQLHTPMALLLNLLLALPVSLFLALSGYALQLDARGQNAIFGAALFEMAKAWLVFYTAYRLFSPGGVAELHFHWGRPQILFLRRQMRSLGLLVMALVAVVTIAEGQPSSLADDVIGIAVVLCCFALMSALLFRMLFRGPAAENTPPSRLLIGMAVNLLPVVLIAGICFGYYYTALQLTDRLIATLYLLMVWVVVEATAVRGLAVAARRLAYQRALAQREHETATDGTDGGEPPPQPVLNIEQVNQQSLRLVRLALYVLLFIGLYGIWAEFITVFSYLDNITLYTFTNGTGATATTTAISLRDLLGALLITAISIILARNLPGLLEVLILSRLKLAQGSAYATTTLLTYLLAGIGFVATLSTLGVSWDKLQWLVAALSVGLGFGLQEIFANFISGLIILFERPVRIGDLVTIGNLTGTVSKIRIRATTITDPDNKEIIVPNKTFITSQLINWTLTDTMTRVVVKVGVAYGSNLDRVHDLLMEIAMDNPRVLRDPEAGVFFLNFGESTLDHELRVYVRELGDRMAVADEIGRTISRRFAEEGLEIAFRQVDVFIKNLKGDEQHLKQEALIAQAAAAGAADVRPQPPQGIP